MKPVEMRGGHSAAIARVNAFLETKFQRYSEEHSEPELCVTSNMSPYLHFGHISAHEIFSEVVRREKWHPRKLALRSNGAREGWWNMSLSAENYLDQLITWREARLQLLRVPRRLRPLRCASAVGAENVGGTRRRHAAGTLQPEAV